MNKKRHGLDLDGIVYDWQHVFADFLKKKIELEFDLRSITTWNWHEALDGLTPKRFDKIFDEFTDKGLYRNLPLIPQARTGLDTIVKNGYEIHFITCRPKKAEKDSEASIKELGIPYASLSVASGSKGDAAKKLRLDVFFDDRPKYLQQLDDVGVKKLYLMNKLYNIREDCSFIRVSNWQEFIEKEGMAWPIK